MAQAVTNEQGQKGSVNVSRQYIYNWLGQSTAPTATCGCTFLRRVRESVPGACKECLGPVHMCRKAPTGQVVRTGVIHLDFRGLTRWIPTPLRTEERPFIHPTERVHARAPVLLESHASRLGSGLMG